MIILPEAPLYVVLRGMAKQLVSDGIFSVLSIKEFDEGLAVPYDHVSGMQPTGYKELWRISLVL